MINKTKSSLRKEALALRDAMSAEERKRGSILITEALLGHQWFYRADNILLFASYGSEVDTTELIKEALERGKKVYLPRIDADTMEFYRIFSFLDLKSGFRGIREPLDAGEELRYVEEKRVQAGETVLMIMPGVCFDKMRHRIGYGKGFYDKYLGDKPDLMTYTIAVGFSCQLFEELPVEENDILPYQVILK